MKTSIIKLKSELLQIQQAHEQLHSFFWGDLSRAVKEDTLKYPLMCCYIGASGTQFLRNETTIPLIIVVADRVFTDYENLDDTESDTAQVLRDIYNTLNKSPRWQQILKVTAASLPKFIDNTVDQTAGWTMQINVKLRDSESFCNLPMPDYDFEGGEETADCLPALIFNSNATFSENVPSGSSFELPDVTLTLNSGVFLDAPSAVPQDIELVDTSNNPIVPDSIVDNKITVDLAVTPTGIVYNEPIYGDGTTSLVSFDGPYHLAAGAYDSTPVLTPVSVARLDNDATPPFLTLIQNNIYGTKFRFADENGLQVFGSGVATDCYTGRMWPLVPQAGNSWLSALSNTNSSTLAGFTDWRLPTLNELITLVQNALTTGSLDYFPFDLVLAGIAVWTNLTFPNDTSRAQVVFFNLDTLGITFNANRAIKTNLVQYLMVRTELT